MGTTPDYGLPYPEASDPPDGATQMQSLATAVDTLVGAAVQAGQVTIPGGSGSVAVTFDHPYATPPRVVLGLQTGTTLGTDNLCWASSITATGFTAFNERGNATSTNLQWIAVGVPA